MAGVTVAIVGAVGSAIGGLIGMGAAKKEKEQPLLKKQACKES